MRNDCKSARALLDGVDPLSTEQQQTLDIHLACCDECRQRQQLWAGLQTAAREAPLPVLDPMVERRLLTGKVPVRHPAPRRQGRPWLAAAALATTCGAAAAWMVVQIVAPNGGVETSPAPTQHRVMAEQWSTLAPLPMTCAAPGTALWLEDNAVVVEGLNDRDSALFHLDRGLVVAEVGTNEPGYRFVVQTPTVLVEALGTIFSVEVRPDGTEVVRVTEGVVAVIDVLTRTTVGHVQSGQEMVVTDQQAEEVPWTALAEDLALLNLPVPTPEDGLAANEGAALQDLEATASVQQTLQRPVLAPTPAVADSQASGDNLALLTSLAHAHQRAGEYESACSVYQRIMETYPDSQAARDSLVTLGQIELSALGAPAQALDHFDAYLAAAPQGVLVEEARVGKVRALAQEDRAQDVISQSTAFLQTHPGSTATAEMMRLRGDAYFQVGDRLAAGQDYEALLARWPTSPQADLAEAGLAACAGR